MMNYLPWDKNLYGPSMSKNYWTAQVYRMHGMEEMAQSQIKKSLCQIETRLEDQEIQKWRNDLRQSESLSSYFKVK